MKTHNLYLLILTISVFNAVEAQTIRDLMGVSYTHFNSTKFSQTPINSEYNDNSFTIGAYDIWFSGKPLKIKKSTIYSNFLFRNIHFNYNNEINDEYKLDDIYELKATFVYNQPLSTRLFLVGIVIPNLASDFKNSLSANDIIVDGIINVGRKFGNNKNFQFALGPHFFYGYGELLITPAITLDYKSNNGKWLANIYWPRINITREINKNIQLGVVGTIDYIPFKLKQGVIQAGTSIDHAQFNNYRAGVQYNHRLFSKIWLGVQAGYSFGSDYSMYTSNPNFSIVVPKNEAVSTTKIENTTYAKCMITYKL